MSAPTITRISPTSGPTTGGITVVITGTNLASPSAVTFGGTSAIVNSSSATSISVTAPAHAASVAQVLVTTAAGTTTQAVKFTYVTVAAPVITSLSPTNGPASGGNTVTISGTNLLYTTGVAFGTTPASSFAILSNSQVAAAAPAGAAGDTTVSVTNGTGTSCTVPYTYNGVAAPVVSIVCPTRGPAAGGNTAVISGSVINAVVPPGPIAGGNVSVLVTGPSGTSADSTTYTYCFNNSGMQWAYYVNPDQQPNVPGTSYSSFDPTLLKTQTPTYTNTTTYMTLSADGSVPIHIYGSPGTFASTYFALNQRGYIHALQGGNYTFTSQSADEIVLYWIGSKAYSGWTRADADLEDASSSPTEGELHSFTKELQEGQYYALRIVYANAQLASTEAISVTAPDGTVILGPNSVPNPYIIQYSCDEAEAPPYPPFGQET
ncbi:hypothetical protein VE00_10814 [Pseudogymnoascus sp. WSF 3629]|nr:hypothetical protein VE00_10814 [Pseudogymnoascus sp. WSF 3629]